MNRPNLLYLLSDQHTASVLGCAADRAAQTPNLDRIAAAGTRLSNLYCASPLCGPSRMSMLTGRHPFHNRVWTNEHILSGAMPTWLHALGAAGYRPHLAGRLHAVGADQLLGYASRTVGDHTPNYPGGPASDLGPLSATTGPERESLRCSGIGRNPYDAGDTLVTASAVDFLEELGRRGNGQPFALSVGFLLPHPPYVAQRAEYQRFAGSVPPPDHPEPAKHPYSRWYREHTALDAVTADERRRARTAYYANVHRLDAMIGEILDALDRNGFADNTLVVYTSDHGDQLGEHGLWWKQSFYEESVKVPGLIAWPGVLPAGAVCDRVVSALDVTATIVDALRARPLPNATGSSLLGLLCGDPAARTAWRDEAFAENCVDSPTDASAEHAGPGGWVHRMIRRGPWKLNYHHGQPPQLFHLDSDPTEQRDLADSPEHRGVRERLTARVLHDWDPVTVRDELAAMQRDIEVLTNWTAHVGPADDYRWTVTPEMSHLEPL